VSTEDVKETWRRLWTENTDTRTVLDRMSTAILSELKNNSGDLRERKVLEAGCGRGLITGNLGESGADAYLLDISYEALGLARSCFLSQQQRGTFIQGDILSFPFKDGSFDMVWNAGVIEHFTEQTRGVIISEISRIVRDSGFFISFNPYDGAFFYKIGKKTAEKNGRWPYGPEFPVRSLREVCESAGFSVLEEYTICFRENLSFLSYVSKLLRNIVRVALLPFPEKFLKDFFGGYLLVTVAVKRLR
jgi:SAM-dependent methyltransferase